MPRPAYLDEEESQVSINKRETLAAARKLRALMSQDIPLIDPSDRAKFLNQPLGTLGDLLAPSDAAILPKRLLRTPVSTDTTLLDAYSAAGRLDPISKTNYLQGGLGEISLFPASR